MTEPPDLLATTKRRGIGRAADASHHNVKMTFLLNGHVLERSRLRKAPGITLRIFEAWDNEDPVDDWERERAKRIEQMQGNRNPFVK